MGWQRVGFTHVFKKVALVVGEPCPAEVTIPVLIVSGWLYLWYVLLQNGLGTNVYTVLVIMMLDRNKDENVTISMCF